MKRRRFDEEDREITAGAPAAIQSLGRRLSSLILADLIRNASRDARAEIFEQGKRVRRIGADECPCPASNRPAGSGYC